MNHIPESPRALPETLGIVGSREFPDLDMVDSFVDSLPVSTVVISGGARGVDQRAEKRAMARGMVVWSFRPVKVKGLWRIVRHIFTPTGASRHFLPGEYKTFPACAHARNSWIVKTLVPIAGGLVSFWDGISTGSASTIDKAQAAGILFAVYTPDSVTPST